MPKASPLFQTVDPDTGAVAFDFTGKLHATGLTIDAAEGISPNRENRIDWVKEDGAYVATTYALSGPAGNTLLIASSSRNSTPTNHIPGSFLTLVSQDNLSDSYVRVTARRTDGIGAERKILIADGSSDFAHARSLVGTYGTGPSETPLPPGEQFVYKNGLGGAAMTLVVSPTNNGVLTAYFETLFHRTIASWGNCYLYINISPTDELGWSRHASMVEGYAGAPYWHKGRVVAPFRVRRGVDYTIQAKVAPDDAGWNLHQGTEWLKLMVDY